MRTAFIKTIKWFGIALLAIAGFSCLHYADTHDTIKPVLPAILTLGAALICGTMFKDLRKRILFISIVFIALCALAAQYAPLGIYILTGTQIQFPFIYGWVGLTLGLGLPVMMYVFYKYGD